MRRFITLLMLLSPPAYADSCALGGAEMVRVELLFGRGGVGAQDWASFLADTVTPSFPDGLTVLDGYGQWRDPARGHVSAEPSTLLLILAAPTPDLAARLNVIRDTFKLRFHQTSVGLVTQMVCAEF
jgi:hypothetical protein